MAPTGARSDQKSPEATGEQITVVNYALMRAAMIEWVQTLAGDQWTNYNESDPGVTILEHLCFALSELGLRAEQSMPAFLASPQSQRLQLQRQGLYPAQDILPGPPLTLLDQRRWLLDQVPHAANVWLEVQKGDVRGLVKASVLPRFPDLGPCLCPSDEADLMQEVEKEIRRAAARCRNLAEDLGEVLVLTPQRLSLSARVNINDQRHPDEILAEILYRLGLYLAPEPRRQSLEARLSLGLSPADLYTGPPMQRGFIADEDLVPVIKAPELVPLKEVMASVNGVLEVEQFEFSLEGKTGTIPSTQFPQLYVDLHGQQQPLQLYRDAHVVNCNPERVQRLLTHLWQEHRQSFNLEQSYLQTFPVPQATTVEDGDYVSIQTLFPSVYGLSAFRLDAAATPRQQAQVRQLKGYLLLFDQLMADCAAQLGFLRDLFSPQAGGDQTYAWRSLRQVSEGVADLLSSDYEAKQVALHQRLDPCEQRQAAILDFFLTIYGQRLQPLPSVHGTRSPQQTVTPQLLKAKRELLRDVVLFSRERGSGLNYRDPDLLLAPTALERRCAMELGARRSGGASSPVTVEAVTGKATYGRLLSAEETRKVRESFLTLDGLMAPLVQPGDADGPDNPFQGKTVAAVLWQALAKPGSYRIGGCDVGENVDLVCLDDSGGGWWLGSFAHARLAHAHAHRLLARAGAQTDAVFLIEWLLLRHARRHPSGQGLPAVAFNLKVSVVVMRQPPQTSAREGGDQDADVDAAQRAELEHVARVVRPLLPAHLEVKVQAYGPRRFRRFVSLREDWLTSLRDEDLDRQASTAYRLVAFLLEGTAPVPQALPGAGKVAPLADAPLADAPPPSPSPPSPLSPSPSSFLPLSDPRRSDPSPSDPSPSASPAAGGSPVGLTPEAMAALAFSPPPRPVPAPPAPVPRLLPPPSISNDLASKMRAVPALAEAEGAWCPNPVEPASLRLWLPAGLRFLLRPLPWESGMTGALAGEELANLLQLGFAVMPYQDPSRIPPLAPGSTTPTGDAPPPTPSVMEELAQRHGKAAGLAAQRWRMSPGTVIWLAAFPRQATVDPACRSAYFNRWAQAIQEAGFATGLLLTASAPPINLLCEWLGQGEATVPPPMLGYSLIQDPTSAKRQLLAGQGEVVRIQADRRGRTPPWLALDPRAFPPTPP
ncbi:MAG: hypothetical protein RLZZ117_2269 [Cyanobacteriota bacterium]